MTTYTNNNDKDNCGKKTNQVHGGEAGSLKLVHLGALILSTSRKEKIIISIITSCPLLERKKNYHFDYLILSTSRKKIVFVTMIIFNLCHFDYYSRIVTMKITADLSLHLKPKKARFLQKRVKMCPKWKKYFWQLKQTTLTWPKTIQRGRVLVAKPTSCLKSIFPFSPVFIQLFWTSQLDDEKFCLSGWRFDECENAYNPVLEHHSGSLRPVSQLIVTL